MPRPPSSRHRPARRLAVCLSASCAVFAMFAGCAPAGDPAMSDADPGSGSQRNQGIEALWQQFDTATDRPRVSLDGLQPRKAGRFSQADVRSLTDIAVDVIRRSAAPDLSKKTPDDAFAFVYARQPTATTFDARENAQRLVPGQEWQWLAASRYPTTPNRAKVLKVDSEVRTELGTLDNGSNAPYLNVTVQAHLLQKVDVEGRSRPIVVRRTVRVATFEPNGGPDYWPSVWARTTPFGNDACSLFRGAQLVPLTDSKQLRTDLRDLKQSLQNTAVVAEPFENTTDADDLSSQVEKECPSSE